MIVDEAEVDKQKYFNVIVGSLDIQNETLLIECLPLESSSNVNSSILLHTVDELLRQLRTVDELLRQLRTKQENFALLVTDAVWFMSLAGKTLKELY